jgi:hypothetical protein
MPAFLRNPHSRSSSYFMMWLKAIKSRVSPRTLDGYKGYIEALCPATAGPFPSLDIKPHHIQTIYIDIRKSPTTVRNLHAAMRACFSYAVKKEYPQKESMQRPRSAGEVAKRDRSAHSGRSVSPGRCMPRNAERADIRIRSRDRNAAGRISRSPLEGPAGLESVSVQQIVSFNRSGGGFYFSKPKTAKSRRLIPISESLRQRLITHRREQNEHRLAMKWYLVQ